jgi:hypothetical protein
VNHSSSRDPVAGVAPGRCPRCQGRLGFGTDSNGAAVERCDCGYRAFVRVRIVEGEDRRPARRGADEGEA